MGNLLGPEQSGSANYGGLTYTSAAWRETDQDDMWGDDGDDPGGIGGVGESETFFLLFGAILFCYPIWRYVRAHYISVLEAKLSESFKRLSERISDSKVTYENAPSMLFNHVQSLMTSQFCTTDAAKWSRPKVIWSRQWSREENFRRRQESVVKNRKHIVLRRPGEVQ